MMMKLSRATRKTKRCEERANVFKTFYVLIGKVSSKDLRIVGKRICHYYGTGQLCKTYGNSTQLFHCIKTVQANAKR